MKRWCFPLSIPLVQDAGILVAHILTTALAPEWPRIWTYFQTDLNANYHIWFFQPAHAVSIFSNHFKRLLMQMHVSSRRILYTI